ncbi:MAG: hypothetical protein FJY92_00995 [Candidatus Hydrogenedentes bacterium]|nr:hypothetical protein [Candidatus Hydrogenedentota bacterium]
MDTPRANVIRRGLLACGVLTVLAFGEDIRPTLTIAGDQFLVDGDPKFLVFISYFDAMRATPEVLDSDFRFLSAHKFDGVRVFPNWWDMRDRMAFGEDTLMDGRGRLRPALLKALMRVIECAARHGLIIDLSFAYETVRGLSDLRDDQAGRPQGELPVNQVHIEDYERGLVQVAEAIRAHRHVFVDIQNEYNGRITHVSDDEMKRLCAAIKRVDAARIVTASLANEIGPDDVARRSDAAGVDVVGWHESRNPWRYDAMDELVRSAKRVTTKPIYLGEPASLEVGLTSREFITAVTKAKSGGAAAWTFHTRAGFDLSRKSLAEQLTEDETAFVRACADAVRVAPWGAGGVR